MSKCTITIRRRPYIFLSHVLLFVHIGFIHRYLSLPFSEIFPCPYLYPMFPFLSRHNHRYLLRVDRDSASTNTMQREESHRWANLKSGTHYSPTVLPAPTQERCMTYLRGLP